MIEELLQQNSLYPKDTIQESDLYQDYKLHVLAEGKDKTLCVTCFVISAICMVTSTPNYHVYGKDRQHIWTGEDREQAIKYYNQI